MIALVIMAAALWFVPVVLVPRLMEGRHDHDA